MNGQHQNVNADGEGFTYVEALVRRHLSPVIRNNDVPLPCPARVIDDVQRSYLLPSLAAALEQDHDIGLSFLVRAAINVSEDVTEEEAENIDQFLRTFADTAMVGTADAGIAFLQTIFEALIRREEFHHYASFSVRSSPDELLTGITVSIANHTMEVPFPDILSCFWTTVLETVCHVCHQPFIGEPPIRTIAKHMFSSTSNLHIQVFNRHFSCLQNSGVFFVPVSHVWDDSIRRANELQLHNDEAASTLISTLKALLQGAEDAYNPGVEFWHDYFSVPQWHLQIKESLLVSLPAIYHQAEEILVHMADIPPEHVSLLLVGNLWNNMPMVERFKRIPLLRALCETQWMQRMWVTLEYSQSRAACIMDQSNTIRRAPEGTGPLARDTFSFLISAARDQLLGLFRFAESFAKTLRPPGELLGRIASKERDAPEQLCLGEAMELIATKHCQVFRDRFLAIHVLMNPNILPNEPLPIPRPDADACQWVWRDALSKGDYSVLLLQPRECSPSSNPGPGFPSWLVGYQSLEGAEWAAGNQISAPERPPIIQEDAIKVLLETVGKIEKIHYLEMEEAGEVSGVEKIIGILAAIAHSNGTILSPQSLYNGLLHIFPFATKQKKMAWVLEKMVFSFEECQEKDREFTARLQRQLEVFAAGNETWWNQRQEAAEEISKILELERHIAGDISRQKTRLTRSRHIAQLRKGRGAKDGEPICEIRCPHCRRVSLFRLDLRNNGRIGDMLYRIPGLGYSDGVENGIGLVINNGKITGRMLYGPPVCGCRLTEAVDIR